MYHETDKSHRQLREASTINYRTREYFHSHQENNIEQKPEKRLRVEIVTNVLHMYISLFTDSQPEISLRKYSYFIIFTVSQKKSRGTWNERDARSYL